VAGNELFQPYSGDIVFNAASASAPTLPDNAATTLKAGTAVTVPITITNNGASPQELFLDPRLDTTTTMTLPVVPPTTATATLPNTGVQFPVWFVPNETSALTVNQTSTVPAMFDVGAGAGDPDLVSSAPSAGPLCGSTAALTYAPPGAVVTAGQWVAGPAGCGPYPGPGAAGTATDTMSIQAKAFDPAVTDSLGDYNLIAINPTATAAMTVLQPGQSIVVPVTITPSGPAGSVVSGTLYVDTLVGGLLPVGGASGVLPAGQIAGVEMAALPYKYTVG
jgi:hypothetical protein